MRNSNAIKNLSIAVEALSRVSEYDAQRLRERIYTLLDNAIKEDENPLAPLPRPAPTEDDEIPF